MPEPRDHLPSSTKTQSDGADALASALSGDTVSSPDPPDSPTLRPSEHRGEVGRLGRYRVLQQLGVGGMGAVYLAFDEGLRRRAALKVMLPKFAAVPAACERFLREARTCAGVKSEHVVTLYDVGEDGGVPFIAMEYLQGYPLDEYLKRHDNRLSVSQVLRVGREVALGLAAAHALGLVHRDIKPANLWLEAPKGRVKILDFGLAKAVVAGEDDGGAHLTNTGAVVGTPAYMSPEQARGQPVDARTDLFSLGGVLYRLTTGRLPFTGPTTMAVLTSLGMDDPPPVRALNPAVPDALADLIHRLLAKKPAHRPPSAAVVAAELKRIERALAAGELSAGDPVPLATAVGDEPQVIYVPIQVTAHEPSAFAGLDEPSSADAEGAAVRKPKRERPRRGGWMGWAAVAASVLLAGWLGAVLWWKLTAPKPVPQPPEQVRVVKPPPPQVVVPPTPPTPPVVPTDPTFFNGTDLTGWTGDTKFWKVENGVLVGKTAELAGYKRLRLDRPTRDFEVSFEARTVGAEASLRFRKVDRVDAGVEISDSKDGAGSVFALDRAAFTRLAPPADASRAAFKPGAFNSYSLRVVGKRVTVSLNGVVASDAEHPALLPEGGFVWSMQPNCEELRVRKIVFRDLKPVDPTFFNGTDLTGWTGDAKFWKVEDGEIVGTQTDPPAYRYLTSPGAARDFELEFDARSRAGGPLSACELRFRHALGNADRTVGVQLWPGPGWLFRMLPPRPYETLAKIPPAVADAAVQDAYKTFRIRVQGRRVTVNVNGVLASEGEYDLPDGDRLSWVMSPDCAEVRIKNVRFRDLSKPSAADILTSPAWAWTGEPVNLGDGVNTAGDEYDPAVIPDGLRLVFTRFSGGDRGLYEARRKSVTEQFGDARKLDELAVGADKLMQPFLSADGLSIWFRVEQAGGVAGKVWTARRADRGARFDAPKPIDDAANGSDPKHPAVSPDGQTLYLAVWHAVNGHDIAVCRRAADGSWGKPERFGPEVNTDASETRPWPLADGSGFAFLRVKPNEPGGMMLATPKAGSGWDVLLIHDRSGGGPSYSADGRLVFFHSPSPPGGKGGHDLWQMKRERKDKPVGAAGEWKPAFAATEGEMKPNFVAPGKTAKFAWEKRDGEPVLVATGHGTTVIHRPGATWRDFHLRYEFRWPAAAWTRHDLIFHRPPKSGNGFYYSAYTDGEVKLNAHSLAKFFADEGAIRDGRVAPVPGGETFDFKTKWPRVKAQRPAGEWNTMELLCLGDTSVHRLNGRTVGVFANLREKRPDDTFARLDAGTFSLGVEGDTVEFRRVEVRDISALPPEVVAAADPERKADRAAVEWVLSKRGEVLIDGDAKWKTAGDALPREAFKLTGVRFLELGYATTDDDLARFAGCPDVVHFQFWHSKIGNRGVETLVGFPQATGGGADGKGRLMSLTIESPGMVTEDALKAVARCTGLQGLGLKGQKITDAGLPSLYALTRLKYISLHATAVTADGVKKLAAALPACKIEWDGRVIEPTKK